MKFEWAIQAPLFQPQRAESPVGNENYRVGQKGDITLNSTLGDTFGIQSD